MKLTKTTAKTQTLSHANTHNTILEYRRMSLKVKKTENMTHFHFIVYFYVKKLKRFKKLKLFKKNTYR